MKESNHQNFSRVLPLALLAARRNQWCPRNKHNSITLQPYNVPTRDPHGRAVAYRTEKKKNSNGLHSTLRHASVLRAQ